jgi:hypothetical protein
MKTFRRLSAFTLIFAMVAATAFAFATRPPDFYGEKYHGIILDIPEDRIGIWNIGGKRVEVFKETYFVEEQGKAEPGAFVEAIGKKQGNVFKAYKIEVKLAKK